MIILCNIWAIIIVHNNITYIDQDVLPRTEYIYSTFLQLCLRIRWFSSCVTGHLEQISLQLIVFAFTCMRNISSEILFWIQAGTTEKDKMSTCLGRLNRKVV